MFGRFIRQIWRSALLSHGIALALVSALLVGPWFIATQTIFGVGQLNYALHEIEESFVGQLVEKAEAFFDPLGSLVFADIVSNPTKAWIVFTACLLIWLSFIMRALTRMHPNSAANLPGRFIKRWVSALNLPIVGLVAAFVVVWSLGEMSGPPLDLSQGQFGAVFGILAVLATSVFLFFLYGWLPRWKAGFLVRALVSFSIAFAVLGLTAGSKYFLTVYHLSGFLELGKFAFVALLLWSFLTWLAVLIGAQLIIFFSAENAMAEVAVTAAQEMDLALAALRELGHLSEDRKWASSERLSSQIGCKYAAVKLVLAKLEVLNIVKSNGKDSWGLVNDLGDITLKDVGLATGTYLDEGHSLKSNGMDPVTERSLQALSPEWDQDLYSAFKGRRPDLMELESVDGELREERAGADLEHLELEAQENLEIEEPEMNVDGEGSDSTLEMTESEEDDELLELESEADDFELTSQDLERNLPEDLPPPIPSAFPVVSLVATAGGQSDDDSDQDVAWFVDQKVVGEAVFDKESGAPSSPDIHPWFQETSLSQEEEVEELNPVEPGSLEEIRKAIEAEAQKS